MVIKGDEGPQEEDNEVFSLRQIKSLAELEDLQDQTPDMLLDEGNEGADEFKPKFKKFVKGQTVIDDDGAYHDDGSDIDDSDTDAENSDSDDSERLGKTGLDLGSDEERGHDRWKKNGRKIRGAAAKTAAKKDENPLIADLDTRDKDTKRQQRVQLWFEKDNLKDVEDDLDEDNDLDKLATQYTQKGVTVLGEQKPEAGNGELFLGKKAKRRARHGKKEEAESSDSDYDSADEAELGMATSKRVGGNDGYDVVFSKEKKIKLNEEELALGALMVQSGKSRRDLYEAAWNRYAFNDEGLPDWFAKDEMEHMRKETPVTPELAAEYRRKVQELNVRPIKKVMEAKARKKRHALKRFEKAKKKAEAVLENADATAQEKVRQIKKCVQKISQMFFTLLINIVFFFP